MKSINYLANFNTGNGYQTLFTTANRESSFGPGEGVLYFGSV